ncbi:MAG: helicase HerA domain-containing protein, partial [Dehalococcoidia bacterium]
MNDVREPQSNDPSRQHRPLGVVMGGSLTGGLEVKLEPEASVEDIKVGTFITVRGEHLHFFGVVTDVSLEATDPRLRGVPASLDDPFLTQVLSGTTAYGAIKVLPMLTISGDAASLELGPQPAKTVPSHFSRVYPAEDRDIELVFGREDERHFYIGNPLDMETKVCLDLGQFVQRSNGVFGKSGTGKTFLTRLLLIGLLQKSEAVNLVFDMHSEYGWSGRDPERRRTVKGLKQLFGSRVAVFSLDEESSRRRGISPDAVVTIGYDEIEPQDVEILREALNLSEVAADAAYLLQRRFGRREWVSGFLALEGDQVTELAQELNVNPRALASLHNRLLRLHRLGFVVPQAPDDSVRRILDYLDRGIHVVLEFGRYGDEDLAYVLVANLLTRRLREQYVRRVEASLQEESRLPRPLVITIEEAHKFLSPAIAAQTIFGTIAREMRKYNVTLLVVDQRPSAIDSEVMSQLGTKIACLLDNERDIEAVLAGVSGGRELRAVLARLESKQQALVFGHSVPMPLVVRVREYGTPESYADLGAPEALEGEELERRRQREIDELFGG